MKCSDCIHLKVCKYPDDDGCLEFMEERPHGDWLRGYTDHYFHMDCSNCYKRYRLTKQNSKFNLCPNCGADMRKEGEAE